MQRHYSSVAGSKQPGRKEWAPSGEREHPREARHARAAGSKTRRIVGVRADEAEHQIRELRALY